MNKTDNSPCRDQAYNLLEIIDYLKQTSKRFFLFYKQLNVLLTLRMLGKDATEKTRQGKGIETPEGQMEGRVVIFKNTARREYLFARLLLQRTTDGWLKQQKLIFSQFWRPEV